MCINTVVFVIIYCTKNGGTSVWYYVMLMKSFDEQLLDTKKAVPRGTAAVPRQYRCSTAAVPRQYRAVPRQYRAVPRGTAAVPRQYRGSTAAVPRRYRGSTAAVPRQYRTACRLILVTDCVTGVNGFTLGSSLDRSFFNSKTVQIVQIVSDWLASWLHGFTASWLPATSCTLYC